MPTIKTLISHSPPKAPLRCCIVAARPLHSLSNTTKIVKEKQQMSTVLKRKTPSPEFKRRGQFEVNPTS
jgi:hypothetical protein